MQMDKKQESQTAADQAAEQLDASQKAALRRIIGKKLAIVQGPPGTGKTHVSVVALRQMLSKMQYGDPPIIIACQTNHALDQLLNHVAAFEPAFARLGSRSTDQGVIQTRTLSELREAAGAFYTPELGRARKQARQKSQELIKLLAPLKKGCGPLDHVVLQELGIISEEQATDLERTAKEWTVQDGKDLDTPMGKWIGKHLKPAIIQPYGDACNFEYEKVELENKLLGELEAETVTKDDDDFELKGDHLGLSDNFCVKTANVDDEKVEQDLRKGVKLSKVPQARRSHF